MTETVATYSVPEHHVNMYTANVRGSLAKKGGLLTGLVSRGSYTGDKVQVVNFIGPVAFTERNSPYGDTKVQELEHTQRWITSTEYDCAVLIDRLDQLKMIYDPTSPYVERFREAAARKQDEIIMDRFFADAKTGKEAGTTTPYNTANTVVHGGTGLTVAKLRSLRKLMKKKHIDMRAYKPYIAVTAEEVDDLLGETTVTSMDYNSIKTLVDGEVNMFMGFVFVPYEDYGGKGIPFSNPTRSCPVWVPDGMHFGSWNELAIIISPRPDKNNIKQIHGTFTAGATRLEETKVFCVEAQ